MPKVKFPSTRLRPDLGEAWVNKSNALVQAAYKLTLMEQRIILASVAKLDSRRQAVRPAYNQTKVRIYAAEFSEAFGIPLDAAYAVLKETSAKLYEQSVQTFDGRVKARFRWLQKEAYADGEGYVELMFTLDAMVYLTALKSRFTSYQLKRVAHFRSNNTIRVFEMLVQAQRHGAFRITLPDFIQKLGLPYERWIHVKQRVIDPVIKELKEKSNIDLVCEPKKVGRSVAQLYFKFQMAAQSRLDLEGSDLPTDLLDQPTDLPLDLDENGEVMPPSLSEIQDELPLFQDEEPKDA